MLGVCIDIFVVFCAFRLSVALTNIIMAYSACQMMRYKLGTITDHKLRMDQRH